MKNKEEHDNDQKTGPVPHSAATDIRVTSSPLPVTAMLCRSAAPLITRRG